MKFNSKLDLYSCDFKNRKTFESKLEMLIDEITPQELKETTQITIWDNKITLWSSPCGINTCINKARCIK